MTRTKYFGLIGIVCFGLLAAAAINHSIAQQRVAFGGAGNDILHMGPFLEVKGEQSIPVVYSSQSTLFRVYNDGQQPVKIFGGPDGKLLLALIEPGKFQFVGDSRMIVAGTEKEKVTTVYFVHLK
jgi:hypothetical protein